MSILQAMFLGLVQGLTEFLPISSSGHLVVLQRVLDMSHDMVFFDVMVHFGTLLAVLVFFRRDLAGLIAALLGRDATRADGAADAWSGTAAEGRRFILWIIVGIVPAGVAFLLFGDAIKAALDSTLLVGGDLILTGVALALADRVRGTERKAASLGLVGALTIGLAQAFAMLPGVSRSGATICAALFFGLERREAARFSFILAIPVIFGGAILELRDAFSEGITYAVPTMIGTAIAFASGLFALQWLIRILTKGRLIGFAFYCWAVGGAVVIASLFFF